MLRQFQSGITQFSLTSTDPAGCRLQQQRCSIKSKYIQWIVCRKWVELHYSLDTSHISTIPLHLSRLTPGDHTLYITRLSEKIKPFWIQSITAYIIVLSFLFISSLQCVLFLLFCWINAIVSSARTFNFGLVGVGNNKNDNKTIFQSTLSWLVGNVFFSVRSRIQPEYSNRAYFRLAFYCGKKVEFYCIALAKSQTQIPRCLKSTVKGMKKAPRWLFHLTLQAYTRALSSNISNITYITFNFQPFVSRTLFPLFAEPLAAARNTQCYCKSIFVCIAYTHTHTLYT